MLAHITRDQILAAMQLFDADLCPSEPWAGWEQHQAARWAIVHNARRYPIKAIVARAAGVGVHTFSGGAALNQRIARLGFTVVRLDGRAATPAPPSAADNSATSRALHDRITALKLQLIAAQTRTRLALSALAAVAELAQHAEDCPADPCCCGYTEAEARAADVTAFSIATTPTLSELHQALTHATVCIVALDALDPCPDLPFGLYNATYHGQTLVALEGAKIVGFVQYDGETIAAVESRQCGVGGLLIAHLQGRYDALEVPYALADAAPFWEKCGFHCAGPATLEQCLIYSWTRPPRRAS